MENKVEEIWEEVTLLCTNLCQFNLGNLVSILYILKVKLKKSMGKKKLYKKQTKNNEPDSILNE